jgi:hypothetical protein
MGHKHKTVSDAKVTLGEAAKKKGPFKVIRLRIGNTSQEKYNEIDAVKLIGNTTTPI